MDKIPGEAMCLKRIRGEGMIKLGKLKWLNYLVSN